MRKPILALLVASAVTISPTVAQAAGGDFTQITTGAIAPLAAVPLAPPAPDAAPVCNRACKTKREYRKLRRATPREPIPTYITQCESHGNLRALNPSSGAGGRYQILPSTWAANLPSRHFVRVAGGNDGPRWSSRLLQDRVALAIYQGSGPGAWSCA